MTARLLLVLALMATFTACSEPEKDLKADFRNVVEQLKKDVNHEFLKTLQPTETDVKLLFQEVADERVLAYSNDRWEKIDNVPTDALKPDSMEDSVAVLMATAEELRNGQTNGLDEDYATLGQFLQPNAAVFGVQYLNADGSEQKTRGAFFHTGERWVLIPRVYKAF